VSAGRALLRCLIKPEIKVFQVRGRGRRCLTPHGVRTWCAPETWSRRGRGTQSVRTTDPGTHTKCRPQGHFKPPARCVLPLNASANRISAEAAVACVPREPLPRTVRRPLGARFTLRVRTGSTGTGCVPSNSGVTRSGMRSARPDVPQSTTSPTVKDKVTLASTNTSSNFE
jgi:hypothetical protein